jgi:hypothetical protein
MPRRPAADEAAAPPRDASGACSHGAVVAFALLIVVLGWFHRTEWLTSRPPVDERIYMDAFELLRQGQSPYAREGFLYTPAFAVLGAAAVDRLGAEKLRALLRLGALASAAAMVWWAWAGSRSPWLLRFSISALFGCWLLVYDGLRSGNVMFSFVVAAWLGILLRARHPVAAGALLGASVALKPLAVPLLALAVVPQAGRAPSRRQVQLAIAAALAALALLAVRGELLLDMASRAGGMPARESNASLHKGLWSLGVPIHPVPLFALVMIATLVVWRRRRWSTRGLLVLGGTASVLALPVVNPSTFAIAYPAMLLALERTWQWRDSAWTRRVAEAALVLAAILSVHGSQGMAATAGLPVAVQGVVALIPAVALLGLTAFALGSPEALRAPREAPLTEPIVGGAATTPRPA